MLLKTPPPLCLPPATNSQYLQIQISGTPAQELNHGRLAMLGIAGMVVQELVTGAPLQLDLVLVAFISALQTMQDVILSTPPDPLHMSLPLPGVM